VCYSRIAYAWDGEVAAVQLVGPFRHDHPVIRPRGRDLLKEALAVGNVPEGTARGGEVPFRVVLANEFLDRVGSPWGSVDDFATYRRSFSDRGRVRIGTRE
jgi:hypothetical protein